MQDSIALNTSFLGSFVKNKVAIKKKMTCKYTPDIAHNHFTKYNSYLKLNVLDMEFESNKWRNMQGAICAKYGYKEELSKAEVLMQNL